MNKKFVVACGGTGGHAFPGLAVAQALRARGHEVTVWSSGRAIEQSVLKAWDGEVFSTGARPLSGKNVFANLYSFWRCCREMKRHAPDAVLAMGSYSSLPPVLAAVSRRIPVVLHEANTVPGRAVEFLSRYARCVAVSFPQTVGYLKGRSTEVTGLPIRRQIIGQPRFEEVPADSFCLFVTGGSQGAHRVNELAVQAAERIHRLHARSPFPRPLFVIHQTGAADEAWVRERYEAARIPSRVCAFEPEMGRAFASADLVVARAGAATCFELACVGKPAFFIPLPSAVRNHQHYNACSFVEAGAADEGLQDSLTAQALAHAIMHKMTHPDELARRAAAMATCAVPDAAERVADLLEKTVAEGAS